MIVMSLPITNGLVGWYKGMTWNGISWPDLSGNGNDCTETRGTVRKTFDYIYGGTGDGIRFPDGILPSTYTLFHVARYNGSSRGRIFDGVTANWLSGFWSSKTGVAYHDGWLTQESTTNFPLDEILISTDQKGLYRGNGIDLTINSVTGSNKQLSINYGYYTGERSDWAVWEVIVYDRELSLEEIKFVESYLSHYIHPYTNPVVPRGVNYFNPRDIVFYKQTGYYTKINQMTGNTTNMPGFGDVVASGSSQHPSFGNYYQAFNGAVGNEGWHSGEPYDYDASTGVYYGTRGIGNYLGEWLKIQFPVAVFLNYSVLYARTSLSNRLVKTGYLLASNDNTNWSVVQYINRTPEAYTETSFVLVDKYIQKPFKYYAVVVSAIFSNTSTQISEWYMDVKVPEFQINNPYLLFMDFDYWYIIFNRQSSANWTIEQSGSNPDVFLKLNDYGTNSSYTYLWYELRIQDYDYLRIEFEYSIYGTADGTTFKIGCPTAVEVGGERIISQAFNVNMQIYNGVNKFRIYKNGVVKIAETPLIKAASDGAYAWTPVKIIYNKGTYKTWTIYHNNTLLVEYDDPDIENWLNNVSGSFFGFGSRTGGATANQEIRRVKIITSGEIQFRQDGSTPLNAAYSASQIVANFPELGDGVYWINLPEVGPTQVYCILNTDCAGGGWMLAMKGTTGTTFNFDSDYWTTTNTLNENETNRNDGDAKYHTFNHFKSSDWLAIFPDAPVNGGDVSGGYGGWTWVENNAVGSNTTVREFYANPTQIRKLGNGVVYTPATDPTPTNSSKFSSSIWSTQNGFQWYGINYTSRSPKSIRWGFAWNNEANEASNDVTGGIGLKYASYSAGDAFNCCQVNLGVNRSMRFEWYVR